MEILDVDFDLEFEAMYAEPWDIILDTDYGERHQYAYPIYDEHSLCRKLVAVFGPGEPMIVYAACAETPYGERRPWHVFIPVNVGGADSLRITWLLRSTNG